MHSLELFKDVVSAAEEIHQALGPTLFRETYTVCLAMELSNRGYQVQTKRARLTPGGVDHIFINDQIRLDIDAAKGQQEHSSSTPVRVRKGTSNAITLYLNFATKELLSLEAKGALFEEIVSIVDISPYTNNEHLQ